MNLFTCNKNRRSYFFRNGPPMINIYHSGDHFKGFWSWWDCYIKPLIIKIVILENYNAKRTYTKTDQNAPPFPGA